MFELASQEKRERKCNFNIHELTHVTQEKYTIYGMGYKYCNPSSKLIHHLQSNSKMKQKEDQNSQKSPQDLLKKKKSPPDPN